LFNNFKISYKLNFYISLLLFSAMTITAGITYYVGKQELFHKIEEKLHVVNHLKIERVRSLFAEVDELIDVFDNDVKVKSNLEKLLLIHGVDSLDFQQGMLVRKIRNNIKYRNEPSIIHNFKIIGLDGMTLVSEKPVENTIFEKTLYHTMNEFFGRAHNHSVNTKVHYEDSIDEYVLYTLAPVHINNQVVAIFSVQLYMRPIYRAISDTTGLGNTGESVLTVFEDNQLKFISPLRTDFKGFLDRKVDLTNEYAIPAIKSVSEKDGFIAKVKDYNNVAVDAAWNSIPELGWGIYSKINHNESFRSIFSLKRQLILIASVLIVTSVFFVFLLTRRLLSPIEKIKTNMTKLADGDFPDIIYHKTKDELYETIKSMNFLVKRLKTSTELALAIGKGHLDQTFVFDKNNDVLSRSLLSMRDNLLLIEEESNKRKWVAEGIALQSEVIRNATDDFDELSQMIISTLTEYIGAQHGGLYIQRDDFIASLRTQDHTEEVFYELIASYAYETLNKSSLRFKPGQGLVGQCALERRVVEVKNVELEFSQISSGLGQANRGSMLLVPLIVNEETLGVIELTSFNEIKPHVVEFVLKVGENIASTILAAKSSDKTNKLLRQSQGIIKELKLKQKELIEYQHELNLKEQRLVMKNDELKSQIDELKRELTK
jgi:methyl-accepting chemotaxis protein